MRRRSLLLCSTVLAVVLLWPAIGLAQTGDSLELAIRDTRFLEDGTTEIVVAVTGEAAPDVLAAGAFTVTEQGDEIDGLSVEPLLRSAGSEVAVSLVIDISGSMAGEPIAAMRDAAAGLAEQLTADGVRVQVIAFDRDIEVLVDFSADPEVVVPAISSLETGGGTSLYDAVVAGSDALAEVSGQPNLILFSDGADSTSDGTLDDAVAAAQAAGSPVTTVALDAGGLSAEAVTTLEQLANATGGRVLFTDELEELEALFDAVAAEIASQYVLRYESDRLEPSTLDLGISVETEGGAAVETTFSVPNQREAPPEEAAAPRVIDRGTSPFANPAFLWAGVAAAFVALLSLFMVLFTGARTRADKVLDAQLSRYIQHGDVRAGRSSLVAAHFRDRAMELLEASPRPKGFDEKLTHQLEQAGWPLRNSEFLAMVFGGGVGIGLLFSLVFNPLGGILVGVLVGAIPFLILSQRRAKRHDAFLRMLPDTLQLMAGSLRAGYGVLQAIDSVAKESEGVTAEEFGRVLTEARLGMPLEQALDDMAARIDNDDFRWVVLAINIQREVGGNLAELLDTVAEVLREREMLRRQIKVLSAEGRLSAVILIGLPIFLAIYLILVRPDYIAVLVTSGIFGWFLVISAVLLMIAGVIWIRRLIRIEV